MPVAELQPERLYFEEADGQRRRVMLSGHEAPFGHHRSAPGWEDGGEVRRSLKWEPGTNPPAVHVTGTKERDLTIRGHLRDSLTGNNGFGTEGVAPLFEGRADRIKDEIEAVRMAARPLRIVWQGGLCGGLLVKTTFGREAAGEYQYELTFDVYWRGSPPKRRVRRPLAATSVAGGIQDLVTGAPAALVKVPGLGMSVVGIVSDVLGACVGPMAQVIALAGQVEGEVLGAALEVLTIERRCKALASAAAGLVARVEEAVGQIYALPDPDDARDAAAWRRARADALNALHDAAAKAYQLGLDAEHRGTGLPASVTTAKADDTLDDIAKRIGTSVTKLRAANPALPLGKLDAGTKVRVPGA